MPVVGFEPTILAGKRQQIYALDCATTGTGAKDNGVAKIAEGRNVGHKREVVRQVASSFRTVAAVYSSLLTLRLLPANTEDFRVSTFAVLRR
jgi:hypothetical protein